MKAIKLAKKMMTVWFIHFIIYNTYYGWNLKPINETEAQWDMVSQIWLFTSFIIYLSPLIHAYEKALKGDERE
jgi:hypothetical protein